MPSHFSSIKRNDSSPLCRCLWLKHAIQGTTLPFQPYDRLLVHCAPEGPQLDLCSLRNDLCLHSMPADKFSVAVSHAEVQRSPERHQHDLPRCHEQPMAQNCCCPAPKNTLARKTSSIK